MAMKKSGSVKVRGHHRGAPGSKRKWPVKGYRRSKPRR